MILLINGKKGIADILIFAVIAIVALGAFALAMTSLTTFLTLVLQNFTTIMILGFGISLLGVMVYYFYKNKTIEPRKSLMIAGGFSFIFVGVSFGLPFVMNATSQIGTYYTADAILKYRVYCSRSGGFIGEACIETTMDTYSLTVENFEKVSGLSTTPAVPSLCILWGCDKHVQFSGTIAVVCDDQQVSVTPISIDEIQNVPDTGVLVVKPYKLVNLPVGGECRADIHLGSKTTFITATNPQSVYFTVPAG